MSKTLNVLYQSNEYYAVITGVSMTSLMENNKELDEINFFLLNDQISKENLEKFEICCKNYGRNLTIIETDKILTRVKDDLGVAPYKGTYTTYFKLLCLKDIPISTDRILQLDGDTIINSSLEPLIDMDLNGYILAATYDCIINDYKPLVDIPPTDKYYNCGVLLVNQPEWISEDCEQQIADHLKQKRSGYLKVDQDIINVLFRHKIKYLNIKYNLNVGFYLYGINESFKIYGLKPEYFASYEDIKAACENPVINHCMGDMSGRPWEKNNIHPQNDLYESYQRISPWKDVEKAHDRRAMIFRVQRLLYQALPRGLYAEFHKFVLMQYLKNLNKKVRKINND